jgi:hypothetical protein
MKLDRNELLRAIAFLKPAIFESEQPHVLEYMHVQTIGERCQLTTSNGKCGKRVTLFSPQQLQFGEEEERQIDREFMIDKPILEAYEKLLQKHRAAFSKAAKAVHTLNYIDIGPFALESHKDTLKYEQPKLSYPDLDDFFVDGNFTLSEIRFDPTLVSDVLKSFPGFCYASFEGHEEYPGCAKRVYLQIESGEYQAFFCPVIPREAVTDE